MPQQLRKIILTRQPSNFLTPGVSGIDGISGVSGAISPPGKFRKGGVEGIDLSLRDNGGVTTVGSGVLGSGTLAGCALCANSWD